VKRITKRLTYANVMSSIAVFLVLGGATAFAAAQLGKNSVGTKQLKRNAVTAAKIKRNAVTSTKIKKGAVTGAKIKLSSLGTVPSASNASTLTGFSRKGLVRLAPTNGATQEAAREAAPATTLLAAGPFTLYAKCYSFATTVRAEVFISTSANGAIFNGESEELDGSPAFLNTATLETKRSVAFESIGAANASSMLSAESSAYYAIGPEGTTIQGHLPMAVRNGTLPEGDGTYGTGSCLFAGDLDVLG